MWEKFDRLWNDSPAFRYLGPVLLIGAILVVANMWQKQQPHTPPEPVQPKKSAQERMTDDVLEMGAEATSVLKDIVKESLDEIKEEKENEAVDE